MSLESEPSMDGRPARALTDLLSNAPLSYHGFLEIAIPLADAVKQIHVSGKAIGGFHASAVMFDGLSEVALPSPDKHSIDFTADLKSLGAIFYHALTGNPLGDSPDQSALKRIYPVEAKLVVEKLLALHSSGQFVSATELHASLILMRDVFEQSNSSSAENRRSGSARLYLSLSLIALIIVMVWLIVAALHR